MLAKPFFTLFGYSFLVLRAPNEIEISKNAMMDMNLVCSGNMFFKLQLTKNIYSSFKFYLRSVLNLQFFSYLKGTRTLWTTGLSDHALTRGDWRFASPQLCLGIIALLLSVSIGSQHIVWLVYTVWWEQWTSSTIGSIRPDSYLKTQLFSLLKETVMYCT